VNTVIVTMMQLPRGTFREIRKNTTVGVVLKELERTTFSGICSLSSDRGNGTLVYQSGTCILVKFHGKPGDPGWEELQKCGGEVDAALSTLDEAQVQLSLEFNKACRLVKAGKSGPSRKSPARVPSRGPAKMTEDAHQTAAPVRVLPKSSPAASPSTAKVSPENTSHASGRQPLQVPVLSGARPSAGHPPRSKVPPPLLESVQVTGEEKSGGEGGRSPDESAGSSDRDLDTLDIQDLENVTDKIRNDCKTMIRQLNLEHLMER